MVARGLRLLSGSSKAAQESAGAELRPRKVTEVAGHARGPGTAEQGRRAPVPTKPLGPSFSASPANALLPPATSSRPQVTSSPQPSAPLSRELGPAAERQARRGPDRPPLSRSPLPGGSGTCSSRAPGPRAGWLPVQTGPGRGATSLAGDPPLCPPLRLSLSHSWMPLSSWQQKDMTDTVRARQSPSGRGRAEDKNRNIYSYEGLTQGLPDRSVIKSRLEPSAWKRALSGRQRVRKDTPTLPHVRGPKLHGLVRNVQVLGDSAKKMDRKGSATHTGHAGPGRTFTTHCKEGALLTTPVTRAEKTHVRRGADPEPREPRCRRSRVACSSG